MKKVYLASPFFNPEQINVVESLEDVIAKSRCEVYSPMRHGVLKTMNPKERAIASKKIFEENIEMLNWADIIVANTDDFDPGTMFEIGYAFGKNKIIVTFSAKGYGANVMISEASNGHYNIYTDLETALFMSEFNGIQKTTE